jgi:hypothetical protein
MSQNFGNYIAQLRLSAGYPSQAELSSFEEGKGIPDTKQIVAKFFKTWEEKHLNRIKNPISKNTKSGI